MTPERWIRHVSMSCRASQVFCRRLLVTLHAVGGHVELLPHVDAHYRDWLKVVRRRERFSARALARAQGYEPPVVRIIGNLNDLIAQVVPPGRN